VNNSFSQTNRYKCFIGLNPSFTIEPYYESGEVDINIFPIVFQMPITKKVDWRIYSILNYGIRNSGNGLSHIGLSTNIPMYLLKNLTENNWLDYIYFAPGIGCTRNTIEKSYNTSVYIEPGYEIRFKDGFSIIAGVQFGKTYFMYDTNTNKWGDHFGIKVILGQWIIEKK
jgi:hypothetical protein